MEDQELPQVDVGSNVANMVDNQVDLEEYLQQKSQELVKKAKLKAQEDAFVDTQVQFIQMQIQ